MATIRKRVSGKRVTWYVEVRRRGLRKSGTFDTKPQAMMWALSTEQELSGGVVSGKTFGEALERYSKEISPSKKSARTESFRIKKIGRDKMAHVLLANLTSDRLQQWIDEQGKLLKSSSVNRDFNIIRTVLRTARVKWKWMSTEPARDVKRPKDPPPRDRLISTDEIKRILTALEYVEGAPIITMRQQIAVAFLLALETAMRQGEIWGLEWRRVHLKERYVTLEETKNGTRRDVPLSKRAVELLEKLDRADARTFTACTQAVLEVTFRRAVKLAGIENMHFHDARHTAITNLARKVDVLDLARMVGHRDLRSLQIYYNPTASDIAKRLD